MTGGVTVWLCITVNPLHLGEDLENVQDCSFHIWSPVGLSESKTVVCPVIF